MIRVIPYLLYLLLIAAHQVILKDVTSIAGITINLTALIVGLVALYKSEGTVVWFGFFAGLTLAAGNPHAIGWQALALALIGLLATQVRNRLNLESQMTRVLLISGVILVHSILSLLINGENEFWTRILFTSLPMTLYTIIVGWLFFQFKEKRITLEKIKAIF